MAALTADDDEGFIMEFRKAPPTHLLMKIESFSLLLKHGIDKYESKEFEAGDYKWRLVIHPNELIETTDDDEDNHISVYLTIVETDSLPVGWEVTAAFSVFLYNHVLEKFLCFHGKMRRFHALKSQWGYSKLISEESLRAPCNGLLVDDNCVFGVEIAVIKSTPRISQCVSVREFDDNVCKGEWKISNFSKLPELWKSELFTAGDYRWCIRLYPYGQRGTCEEGRCVSMFLYLFGAIGFSSDKKVKADFNLRIKNQLNDQHYYLNASHWFTPSSNSCGWLDFILLSDMRDSNKGFVVEDCCIVEVEIIVEAVIQNASPIDTLSMDEQKSTEITSKGVKKNRNSKTGRTEGKRTSRSFFRSIFC